MNNKNAHNKTQNRNKNVYANVQILLGSSMFFSSYS